MARRGRSPAHARWAETGCLNLHSLLHRTTFRSSRRSSQRKGGAGARTCARTRRGWEGNWWPRRESTATSMREGRSSSDTNGSESEGEQNLDYILVRPADQFVFFFLLQPIKSKGTIFLSTCTWQRSDGWRPARFEDPAAVHKVLQRRLQPLLSPLAT